MNRDRHHRSPTHLPPRPRPHPNDRTRHPDRPHRQPCNTHHLHSRNCLSNTRITTPLQQQAGHPPQQIQLCLLTSNMNIGACCSSGKNVKSRRICATVASVWVSAGAIRVTSAGAVHESGVKHSGRRVPVPPAASRFGASWWPPALPGCGKQPFLRPFTTSSGLRRPGAQHRSGTLRFTAFAGLSVPRHPGILRSSGPRHRRLRPCSVNHCPPARDAE